MKNLNNKHKQSNLIHKKIKKNTKLEVIQQIKFSIRILFKKILKNFQKNINWENI